MITSATAYGDNEKTCAGCKHQFIRCDDCGYCKRDPDLVDNFEADETDDGE